MAKQAASVCSSVKWLVVAFAGHGGDKEGHACVYFFSICFSVTLAIPSGARAKEAGSGRMLWVECCILALRDLF